MSVPLWSQVITRSVALAAVREADACHAVFFDCVIDNVRFVSDSLPHLVRVWSVFNALCETLSITIGDRMPPGINSYTFLGISFEAGAHGTKVAVGEKTRVKLRTIAATLSRNSFLQTSDVLAFFGVTIFAAAVASATTGGQTQLHPRKHYLLFKYMRRVGRRLEKEGAQIAMNSAANVWPCVMNEWAQWAENLSDFRSPIIKAPPGADGTLFTDASDTGWGIIYFSNNGSTFAAGNRWSKAEANTIISEREIRAVRIGLDVLLQRRHEVTSVHLFVDNTNIISWLRKGRSKRFLANMCCEQIANHKIKIASVTYVNTDNNKADYWSRR